MAFSRLFVGAALALGLIGTGPVPRIVAAAGSAHDFSFVSIDGSPLPMAGFAGKAVLLVNTASRCGFTPQYDGLQELWKRYRGRGLVVLGVPSNDFAGQEPGSAAEIKQFCEVNFGIDFPMTDKQQVTGAGAHPLYKWLETQLGRDGRPRWNFHKYLIDADGAVIAGWPSAVEPLSPEITAAIERVLPQ